MTSSVMPRWPDSKIQSKLCTMGEVLQRSDALVERVALAIRRRHLIVVYGVFDGLTADQANRLAVVKAFLSKNSDSCLCVALRSDAAHVRLTGSRPTFDEQKRAADLTCISAVDWVVLVDDPGGRSLIEGVVPDILVKPGRDPVPGEDVVRETGGAVEVCESLGVL